MSALLLAFVFSSLEALVSLAASFALVARAEWVKRVSHYFLSLAAGALLGVAFLDLVPEALETVPASRIFALVLGGIAGSFLLEKLLVWYHCHDERCERHAVRPLIIFGDSLHNFIDGVGIGVSFLAAPAVGALTTFAVILHEIPREGSDVAILLSSGMGKRAVVGWTVFASLMTVVGAVVAALFGSAFAPVIGPLIALVAGTFIYIATADLIPELHKNVGFKHALIESLLLVAGIFIVILPGYALR
ncbi:ZIP family metal transporter [Candidatus Parcubacteria bacterium]|nr:ZIP family metal transporter [Candidatus Parcubacteria bacterium]